MSAEPYVPTVEVVRDAVTFPRQRLGEPRPISGEAFDRFVAKIKADSLREAAAELEDREHCYNDALSAAFVPGETGRGNVIQSYEAILEEPYGWLRERADRIGEEA